MCDADYHDLGVENTTYGYRSDLVEMFLKRYPEWECLRGNPGIELLILAVINSPEGFAKWSAAEVARR